MQQYWAEVKVARKNSCSKICSLRPVRDALKYMAAKEGLRDQNSLFPEQLLAEMNLNFFFFNLRSSPIEIEKKN